MALDRGINSLAFDMLLLLPTSFITLEVFTVFDCALFYLNQGFEQ